MISKNSQWVGKSGLTIHKYKRHWHKKDVTVSLWHAGLIRLRGGSLNKPPSESERGENIHRRGNQDLTFGHNNWAVFFFLFKGRVARHILGYLLSLTGPEDVRGEQANATRASLLPEEKALMEAALGADFTAARLMRRVNETAEGRKGITFPVNNLKRENRDKKGISNGRTNCDKLISCLRPLFRICAPPYMHTSRVGAL